MSFHEKTAITTPTPDKVQLRNKTISLEETLKLFEELEHIKELVDAVVDVAVEKGIVQDVALKSTKRTKSHQYEECDSCFETCSELLRRVRYRHLHEICHHRTRCNYTSVELSKLNFHLQSHTGEKLYSCSHCSYAATDNFKLKRHLRSHTGEKPYECDVCHSRFTQSNSLKAHKLIHAGLVASRRYIKRTTAGPHRLQCGRTTRTFSAPKCSAIWVRWFVTWLSTTANRRMLPFNQSHKRRNPRRSRLSEGDVLYPHQRPSYRRLNIR